MNSCFDDKECVAFGFDIRVRPLFLGVACNIFTNVDRLIKPEKQSDDSYQVAGIKCGYELLPHANLTISADELYPSAGKCSMIKFF